jgi:cytochrome c553
MRSKLMICGLAFAGALLFAGQNSAEARPGYLKAFMAKYDGLAAAAKKAKCGVCHPVKSKKMRNDYGAALGKLTGKNQKDAAKIAEALGKNEKGKSATEGKTFGDLIKAGKLPGGTKVAKE